MLMHFCEIVNPRANLGLSPVILGQRGFCAGGSKLIPGPSCTLDSRAPASWRGAAKPVTALKWSAGEKTVKQAWYRRHGMISDQCRISWSVSDCWSKDLKSDKFIAGRHRWLSWLLNLLDSRLLQRFVLSLITHWGLWGSREDLKKSEGIRENVKWYCECLKTHKISG